jgi:hypothetical protein
VCKKADVRGVRAYHACKPIVYDARLRGIPMPTKAKAWHQHRFSCNVTIALLKTFCMILLLHYSYVKIFEFYMHLKKYYVLTLGAIILFFGIHASFAATRSVNPFDATFDTIVVALRDIKGAIENIGTVPQPLDVNIISAPSSTPPVVEVTNNIPIPEVNITNEISANGASVLEPKVVTFFDDLAVSDNMSSPVINTTGYSSIFIDTSGATFKVEKSMNQVGLNIEKLSYGAT